MTPITSSETLIAVGAASKPAWHGESLLDSGRYWVRVSTRRNRSEVGQHLLRKGAEIVIAPLQAGMQAGLTVAMQGGRSVPDDPAVPLFAD